MMPPRTPVTRSRNKPPATAPVPGRVRKAAEPPATSKGNKRSYETGGRAGQPGKTDALSVPLQEHGPTRSEAEVSTGEDREALKAYLRIRPAPADHTHSPYLTVQSNTTVLTSPPLSLVRGARPPTAYTFTKVFPPATAQSEFYSHVALPLAQALLCGENGLLFAYGLSGAGKTWTVQGGAGEGEQGLIWRLLRSILSSVKGHQGDIGLRFAGKSVSKDDSARESVGSGIDAEDSSENTIKVDKNYSYSVFVSYAEVYNEKIFDLLDPVSATGKRKPLVLKSDPSGGKYIHGLREMRVRSTAEAHAAFATGLLARQVSGTKVNHRSSRSHAIFSIRIVRVHRGRPNDPDSLHSSRLSIVDLAGSERTKATLATGDRLKESGSINKSLMVLGQCMEVLRSNQRKLAFAGSNGGGSVKLGLVPFRHSKLTELFQEFFIGEGRAVMVVNVNPYDGGYDEIVNVMKFSALATQVKTGPMYNSNSAPGSAMDLPALLLPDTDEEISSQQIGEDEVDDESEPEDPLVTHLFGQLEEMRLRLYEAELRCAVVESDTREEVIREMEGRMRAMERMFSERITFDAEQNEAKIDSKIDLINRAMSSARSEQQVLDPHEVEHSDNEGRQTADDSNPFLANDIGLVADTEDVQSATTSGDELDLLAEEESEVEDELDEGNNDSDQPDTDEWRPSEDEESSASESRKRAARRSSARKRSSVPARPSVRATTARMSTATASPDKENMEPLNRSKAPVAAQGGRTSVTRADHILEERHPTPNTPDKAPAKPRKRPADNSSVYTTTTIKVEESEITMIIPDKKARQDVVTSAGEGAVYVPGEGETDVGKKRKRKLQTKKEVVTEEKILELERGPTLPGETRSVKRVPMYACLLILELRCDYNDMKMQR